LGRGKYFKRLSPVCNKKLTIAQLFDLDWKPARGRYDLVFTGGDSHSENDWWGAKVGSNAQYWIWLRFIVASVFLDQRHLSTFSCQRFCCAPDLNNYVNKLVVFSTQPTLNLYRTTRIPHFSILCRCFFEDTNSSYTDKLAGCRYWWVYVVRANFRSHGAAGKQVAGGRPATAADFCGPVWLKTTPSLVCIKIKMTFPAGVFVLSRNC
jgi:hypothetical protein